MSFCFLLQIVIPGSFNFIQTQPAALRLRSPQYSLHLHPGPCSSVADREQPGTACFSRWFHLTFHCRQNPQLLFWVSRHRMGWSNLLVNVRGAYYSIYMWNDFCLSFLRVSGSTLKLGSSGVWRTVGAEQKNRPHGSVHTEGPTKWNHSSVKCSFYCLCYFWKS